MPNQNKKENWEEEFEELWDNSFDRDGDKNTFEFEKLKDFIRQLLKNQRQQIKEESFKAVKKEVDCCPVCGNVCPNCHLGGGACTCCDCED